MREESTERACAPSPKRMIRMMIRMNDDKNDVEIRMMIRMIIRMKDAGKRDITAAHKEKPAHMRRPCDSTHRPSGSGSFSVCCIHAVS